MTWAHRATRHAFRRSPGLWGYHTYDDLHSDALLGAVKATRDFDPEQGRGLYSYTWMRMMGEIYDGMRRRSDWSRTEIQEGATGKRTYSLSALAEYGWDHGEDDLNYDQIEDSLTVHRLLRLLPSREREVITRTYLGGERLIDVARSWGVTEGRVSQVRTAAMIALRHVVVAESAQVEAA